MRILTPTENKRLNELIGFVGLSIAVLLALSLLSYSPLDPSFNVSAPVTRRGPGAQLDRPFRRTSGRPFLPALRLCGVSVPDRDDPGGAPLVPQPGLEAPITKLVGWTMLVTSFRAEFTLIHFPDVRGALPAGGLLGTVLAEGLLAAFNKPGAHVVSISTFFTALFLTTTFSFHTLRRLDEEAAGR